MSIIPLNEDDKFKFQELKYRLIKLTKLGLEDEDDKKFVEDCLERVRNWKNRDEIIDNLDKEALKGVIRLLVEKE